MTTTDVPTPKSKSYLNNRWLWWGSVVMSLLLILFATTFPLIQNYQVIQETSLMGGQIESKPGWFLRTIPASWHDWLRQHDDNSYLTAFENVTIVSLEPPFEANKYIYSGPISSPGDFFYSESELVFLEMRRFFKINVRSDVMVDIQDGEITIIADPVHVVPPGYPIGLAAPGYLYGHTDTKETSTISDQQLAHLGNYTGLNRLILDDTNVTGDGLVHLKDLKSLQNLSLYNTDVTDEGTVHLAGLTQLRKLNLSNISWSNSVRLFSENCHIKTQVSDVTLVHLKNMKEMETLQFQNTMVTDAGLVHLKEMKHLKILNLAETNVTGTGLTALKELPQLEVLSLNSAKVTDVGLTAIAKLKHLQILGLTNTKITDAGLVHLAEMKSLEVLLFNNRSITDKGLIHLKDLNNLIILVLPGVSQKDLDYNKKTDKKNYNKWYANYKPITDAGIAHLQGLTKLKGLNLSGTRISDKGLKYLEGMKNLEILKLDGTNVTKEGFEKLKKALPKCNIYVKHQW